MGLKDNLNQIQGFELILRKAKKIIQTTEKSLLKKTDLNQNRKQI
jgi:hypothetical protein